MMLSALDMIFFNRVVFPEPDDPATINLKAHCSLRSNVEISFISSECWNVHLFCIDVMIQFPLLWQTGTSTSDVVGGK